MSVSLEKRRVSYACLRMEHAYSVSCIFQSILVLLLCILEVSGSQIEIFGGSTRQSNALLFLLFFFGVHSLTCRRMVLVAKAIQRKDATSVANSPKRVATLTHNELGFSTERETVICCLTCGVILPLTGASNIGVLHI